ncbi:MAG TPA: DUF2243 domain-containing protein [Burkholderiaceae bacterium]|jgi:uncharacterized membrane protein|nr:DUF2243 domain-containing protein [Burkholderiaceae bacterium]
MTPTSRYARATPTPVTTAPAILLGIGLGGFVDGIVLHQILQWHSMLSNLVRPSTVQAVHQNMFWDGVFHAATWIVTFVGVMLLWQSGKRGTNPRLSIFLGAMLMGWGAFNLVEGLINHHLLELHNVREVAEPTAWNVVFLALSATIFLIGLFMTYKLQRPWERQPRAPQTDSPAHY